MEYKLVLIYRFSALVYTEDESFDVKTFLY